MHLATISTHDGPAAAVTDGGGGAVVIEDGVGRRAYADVGELLAAGATGQEHAERTLTEGRFEPVETARFLRPVLQPGAVVCVGLNYRAHILEMGRALPEHPTYFAKLPRALTDPYRDVVLPGESDRVDYEGELVVVIGRGGRAIPETEAWSAIAGLTLMNDVSMRDFQRRTTQWFAGKSWEASTPVGPVLVTHDELGSLDGCQLRVTVNGELRQSATMDDLLFDVPALVADLSRIVELRPGDLVATGTPGGVGDAMEPKRFLRDGDVVEVAVDGIGSLRNTFRSQAGAGRT